jgi:hypothetical protein
MPAGENIYLPLKMRRLPGGGGVGRSLLDAQAHCGIYSHLVRNKKVKKFIKHTHTQHSTA